MEKKKQQQVTRIPSVMSIIYPKSGFWFEQQNQKWPQPQQRKKQHSVETKKTASKTETILKRKPSTNQICKLNRFFHRNPAELFNFHGHAPPLMFRRRKMNEKLELEGFFSTMIPRSVWFWRGFGVCCFGWGGLWSQFLGWGFWELIEGWRERVGGIKDLWAGGKSGI